MNEDPNSTAAILQALARALPPEAIDELWIFPPRRIGAGQSTVVVASAFEQSPPAPAGPAIVQDPAEIVAGDIAPQGEALPGAAADDDTDADLAGADEVAASGDVASPDDEPSDRRRILTARFTLGKNPQHQPELRHELAEHGAAPAERVGRVVDGVFRRLDDEPEPPRHARIAGDREKWAELLATLKDEAG